MAPTTATAAPAPGSGQAAGSPSTAPKPSPDATTSALGNIQHVVVLMFENRSFDHLLGAMTGVNGVLDKQGNLKPDCYNTQAPLIEPSDANPKTLLHAIVPNSGNSKAANREELQIPNDFTHAFGHGMVRDIFGPGTTGVIEGKPVNAPLTTYPPQSSGFLSTIADAQTGLQNGPGALTYFAKDSLQVFHKLANDFVVCDAWHCDMPGHTSSNRAYMHCATTGDLGINDNDSVRARYGADHFDPTQRMVNRATVFERIEEAGLTWKMYVLPYADHCDTNWLNGPMLRRTLPPSPPPPQPLPPPSATPPPNQAGVYLPQFFADLDNGNLPFYSFLMTMDGASLEGTKDGPSFDASMHPKGAVENGENMLACVYNALRNSSYWENTLLVVNFDENGGMYDHVCPPAVCAPDYDPSDADDAHPPISTWSYATPNVPSSFDFTLLGPRIPVLLISPWLKAGVCSTQYQNTSILRFVQDLLQRQVQDSLLSPDPRQFFLTKRDLNAPTFAPLFGYEADQFGLPQARLDCPANLTLYAGPNLLSEAFFVQGIPPAAPAPLT